MKVYLAGLAVLVYAAAVSLARAEKPLSDYSFVRGVNYGMQGDQATIERELGYAKRVNLNSTRIWLNYKAYEKDPQGYIDKLRNYMRTSYRLGFTTMPILFNGNGLDPATLKSEFHTDGDAYVKAVVGAMKDEPGLLMWDVMNEPDYNDYVLKATGDEKTQRTAEITAFVRYYMAKVREFDPVTARTAGYAFSKNLAPVADVEDVVSFHDYSGTRARVEAAYKIAEDVAKKYNKPILNSETACIARANPYDQAIEIATEHHSGWYLFNLIIQGYWGEIHGIFYPDGTVRDPTIIAAIMGFQINRNLNTMIRPQPNREGHAVEAIKEIEAALAEPTGPFGHVDASTDNILEAAEHAANLLESAQMVPMIVPPTARIQYWRSQLPEKRDRAAIRAFAYDLGEQLKKDCQLF
jgi:hypothetical protein